VHGEIDTTGGKHFLNFFREHALGANFGQRNIRNFIPRGVDDFDFDFVTASAQE
jgi:hypothetical protein